MKIGFALSILYFVVYYLTPATLFGPLAQFRVELVLALLIFFVSLPAIPNSFVLKTPQSLALIGLAFVVFLSVLFAERWAGGAAHEFLDFVPSIYAYFLICLHCKTRRRLQGIVLILLCVCLFVIAQGTLDLRNGMPQSGPPISAVTGSLDQGLWDMHHPYVLTMRTAPGEWLYRLRGQGCINDPNDFGQLLVCVIPLLLIFWRKNKPIWNVGFVILPTCALLVGVYLTHSRGALLAITAVSLVAARRRFGILTALVIAGSLFFAAMAMHFTGGREISVQSGSDRSTLWSQGLTMLKSHPLVGVGFNRFGQYAGKTAHNSIVVCAAELGLIGFFLWLFFLVPTLQSVLTIASSAKVKEASPVGPEKVTPFAPTMQAASESLTKAQVNRIGFSLLLSLTGFLAAGWFLSRAFVTTLFLLGGMVAVMFALAQEQGMLGSRPPLSRVLFYTLATMVSLLLLVYLALRVLNLMR